MSVFITDKVSDIPVGAEILSKKDAINYQWAELQKWRPKSEIWSLLHGGQVMGVLAAVSGLYINMRIRRRLKLISHGGLVTSIAVAGGGMIIGTASHFKEIVHDMLVEERTCATCVQLKSACIANACSLLHPAVLSSLTNFSIATIYTSMQIPSIRNPIAVLKLWSTVMKPILPALMILFTINTLFATYITNLEQNSLYRVRYFEREKIERLQESGMYD